MIYDEEQQGDALDLIYQLQQTLEIAAYAITQLPVVEADRDYWRKQHAKLVQEDIKRAESTTANLLMLILDGRIKVPGVSSLETDNPDT